MQTKELEACVAFPHLRQEHLAKDVYQFPTALFGQRVCFITRRYDGDKHLPCLTIVDRGGSGDKFNLSEAVSVARMCARYRNVVLFHISYVSILIAAMIKIFSLFRRSGGTRVILQSDFSPRYEENYQKQNIGIKRGVFWLGRLMPRFVFDVVSVASARGKRFLISALGMPENKVFIVYNCPHFEAVAAPVAPVASSIRTNTILFVGRKDDPMKNVCGIISAFEIVARQRPDWRLDLVGPGKLYLSPLNGISIFQEGARTERNHVLQKYREAKIFLMPSQTREGAALAFVEAIINGCYPIATNVGNFSELINKVGLGTVVEEDPPAIAAGILAAIEHVEQDSSLHAKIMRSSMFLNWAEQVKGIRERLCLN
jgi:glycosyltransferase involved in cell wall biosynthesis